MRALSIALAGAILASAPAAAQTVEEQALLHQLAAEVRPERMRADIEALVGFGTRHTMSETTPTPAASAPRAAGPSANSRRSAATAAAA